MGNPRGRKKLLVNPMMLGAKLTTMFICVRGGGNRFSFERACQRRGKNASQLRKKRIDTNCSGGMKGRGDK